MSRMFILRKMLSEHRLGFEMDEVMSGTHYFVNDAGPPGKFPMSFHVTWGTKRLAPWLNPWGSGFMTNFLHGTVSIGGLVEKARCRGTLALQYFSQAKIRYTFDFQEGARPLRYIGEKVDIRPWNLHRTHTTCYGSIVDPDTGQEISRSILYFRFRTLPNFVGSFRLG